MLSMNALIKTHWTVKAALGMPSFTLCPLGEDKSNKWLIILGYHSKTTDVQRRHRRRQKWASYPADGDFRL